MLDTSITGQVTITSGTNEITIKYREAVATKISKRDVVFYFSGLKITLSPWFDCDFVFDCSAEFDELVTWLKAE